MIKTILILCCLLTLSSASLLDFFSMIFRSSEIPARVRTVEERELRKNESVVLDFIGLVERHEGYTADEYNVTTEDGYVLGLHRITGSPLSPKAKGKPVVYLQHGLFGSSDFLVVLGPKQALAFQLADAGYDVWLGNVRGNTYSRRHISYSPDTDKGLFWDFRMDEMGTEDVSKFIDFILEETEQKNLTYIGYSMGTTLSYILLSSKPEYNDKINLLVSIAPVAYFTSPANSEVKNIISTLLLASSLAYELLPQTVAIGDFAKESCSDPEVNPCRIFIAPFLNLKDLNTSAIPEIFAHVPAGTSYYTVQHYEQLMNSGKLQKFDYPCGFLHPSCLNSKKYDGASDPPEYDLSQITVPNAIFYAKKDLFVNEEDSKYLKDKFLNVAAFEEVPDENFNHMDFAWSKKARDLVYNRILEVISKASA